MKPFVFYNPTKIILGEGEIVKLALEIPKNSRILLCYGTGSIKKNGVYDQIQKALSGYVCYEFSGIEPNPHYETLLKGISFIQSEKIDFILAAGGGSIIDACKFMATGALFPGDPWDMLFAPQKIKAALPIGVVLTLSATGSEMNSISVITKAQTRQKQSFKHPFNYPKFAIIDPSVMQSLPKRQVANGIVDAFTHVMEQYLTYPNNAPLQDRFAESLLKTLIEVGPKLLANPKDNDTRATFCWCASLALNGLIGAGVAQDWATHRIGHELTAFYGLDHAQTLAVVLPNVMQHEREKKRDKLIQYAREVWGLAAKNEEALIDKAIDVTREFFESIGVPTHLADYGVTISHLPEILDRLSRRPDYPLGEHRAIDMKAIEAILAASA